MVISKKQALKTVLLPGIIPRLRDFFGSGFHTLAYLIALVYNTVRILPNNHPYLQPDMVGKYSIRQVIAEASNHIKLDKKNIDQIVIFFSVITALVILIIQFVLLVIAMVIPKANAQMPTKVEEFFKTTNPEEDIAYRLLDLVFGFPEFFGSKEEVGTSMHKALHALFEFYSMGMIVVGTIIIIYFAVSIVGETAQSGTPFGQRFNKVWAPIRVILFFGLLIPISHGLNGGQHLTLISAKLGSSLATTGWTVFNNKIEESNETPTGKKEKNIAAPKPSDLQHVPAFMLLAKTCQEAYNAYKNETYPDNWRTPGIQAYAVYKNVGGGSTPYTAEQIDGQTFQDLTEKSKGTDIYIVFGVQDTKYSAFKGSVAPICGELVTHVTDVSEPGTAIIQTAYFDLIKNAWNGDREIGKYAKSFSKRVLNIKDYRDPEAPLPPDDWREEWIAYLKEYMGDKDSGKISEAIKAQIEQGDWQMPQEMKDYGWAGAGIWYNKIAQQNGAFVSAIRLTPFTGRYPRVMEMCKKRKEQEDEKPNVEERFECSFSAGSSNAGFTLPGEVEIARALNHVYVFWEGNPVSAEKRKTGNPLIDTINTVLGTDGLYAICENTDIHPLAQLSAVGKSMIDSSIRSLGLSGFAGVLSIFPSQFSASLEAASGFFGTIASVGLLVGFILFYVLPFMPFIYFFFAVGGWIKGIFEAMVAMPLWALAHLRIDGEGIPGDAAIGGWFLLFEIFIRPILIVFGLLAAITIFAAMVKVLNEVFYLVISNMLGNDAQSSTQCFKEPASGDPSTTAEGDTEALNESFRGPVDEFFFTILYTIIVYMIGTGCFKLIDTIPNNILRWINAEVPSFNDQAGDAAEGLMKYVTLGGSQFGSQLGGSLEKMGGGVKDSIRQFIPSK